MGNNTNTNNSTANGVNRISVSKQMAMDVKNRVNIPMYFYNVIVPQLGNYYDNYPVDFDIKPVVCCPIHDEDTPSCRYYEETNSFYCFGCQRGGDVVQLHRYFAEKLNGVMPSREDAIAYLYNYFVKGKETETFINTGKLLDENLNSDAEIVKFNFYRYNLEKSISFDNSLSLNVKKELWSLLDDVDILLSNNLIKVGNAEKLIKHRVMELTSIKKMRAH